MSGVRPRAFAVLACAVVAVALAAAALLASLDASALARPEVWLLVAGLLATELFAARRLPVSRRSTLTSAAVWAYAGLLVAGPLPGMLLHALGAAANGLVRRLDPWRLLFNLGQLPLSLLVGSLVMVALGVLPLLGAPEAPPLEPAALPAVLVGLGVAYACNQALMVVGLAVRSGASLRSVARETVGSQPLPVLGMLLSSPLVALVVAETPHLMPLLLVPAVGLLRLVRTLRTREHEARHDHLTGLVNRSHVEEVLTEVTRDGQEPAAVLVADLDGFKDINDTLGHHAGDQVLRIIGHRLRSALRDEDVVARLGGDEFAVVVRGQDAVAHTKRWVGRVLGRVAEPVTVGGTPVRVSASVGVALHPRDGDEPAKLLRVADYRMYLRKRAAPDEEPADEAAPPKPSEAPDGTRASAEAPSTSTPSRGAGDRPGDRRRSARPSPS